MGFGAYWYGGKRAFRTGRDLVALVRSLKAHGVQRYIPQWALDNGRAHVLKDDVRRICQGEGVELVLGLGCDPADPKRAPELHAQRVATAIIAALEQLPGVPISIDWEGWWNGKRSAAAMVADRVLTAVPDAHQRIEDCPWWAPLYVVRPGGSKQWTHPNAPTREFGELISTRPRYVQAYGAQADGSPDGRSLAMLAWSRHPTQYAALGAWSIMPTTQMYARSLRDQIATLLREPEQNLWAFNEADARALLALRVVEALRAKSFTGARAVLEFQAAAGLARDGIVGPRTLAALGVQP